MPESSRLPELTRSLRSLGTAGTECMQQAHEAVFGPLLDARRVAANGSMGEAVDAMNGNAILARIEAALSFEATRGISTPARARATTAQVQDAIEPLRRALLALDEVAVVAGTDEGFATWVDQLRRVFSAADDACTSVGDVLSARRNEDTPPRWYARNSR